MSTIWFNNPTGAHLAEYAL